MINQLAQSNPKIEKDEIAQLSLSTVSELQFLRSFNNDIAEISSSEEQAKTSKATQKLIDDILVLKKTSLGNNGHLLADIDFEDRLETQALKHITANYQADDFKRALKEMERLTQVSRVNNTNPVRNFEANYQEGLTALLSMVANEQYPEIGAKSLELGKAKAGNVIDKISGDNVVFLTTGKHAFLSAFTDSLSDEDFYSYKALNAERRDSSTNKNDFDYFRHNIIEHNLLNGERRREANDYFSNNPKLRDYINQFDQSDFSNGAYDDLMKHFAFKSDKSLKAVVDYLETYNSDVLKRDIKTLSPDDKESVIMYNATKLMLQGPDRFEEKNGVSPVEHFLTKQLQKEEQGKAIYPSYDSFKDVVGRLTTSPAHDNLDPKIKEVLDRVNIQEQKQKRFKM